MKCKNNSYKNGIKTVFVSSTAIQTLPSYKYKAHPLATSRWLR
jgi:hypothetical protein